MKYLSTDKFLNQMISWSEFLVGAASYFVEVTQYKGLVVVQCSRYSRLFYSSYLSDIFLFFMKLKLRKSIILMPDLKNSLLNIEREELCEF